MQQPGLMGCQAPTKKIWLGPGNHPNTQTAGLSILNAMPLLKDTKYAADGTHAWKHAGLLVHVNEKAYRRPDSSAVTCKIGGIFVAVTTTICIREVRSTSLQPKLN